MHIHKKVLSTPWEFPRGVEEDQDRFIQKAVKVCINFELRSLSLTSKFGSLSLTSMFHQRRLSIFLQRYARANKELMSATLSQVSAKISSEWKNVKDTDKKMEKYSEIYEVEKQRYEEAPQIYQEDHMVEAEVISPQKGAIRQVQIESVKTLREQLGMMIGEDQTNYCSIVSRR